MYQLAANFSSNNKTKQSSIQVAPENHHDIPLIQNPKENIICQIELSKIKYKQLLKAASIKKINATPIELKCQKQGLTLLSKILHSNY